MFFEVKLYKLIIDNQKGMGRPEEEEERACITMWN